VSAEALTIANGVMQSMLWKKMKMGAIALLVVFTAGVSGVALGVLAGDGESRPAANTREDSHREDSLAAPRVVAPAPVKQKERFGGTWKVKEVEVAGKHNARREGSTDQKWIISRGRMVIHFGDGATEEWTYQLDAAKTPWTIDLKQKVGVKAGASALGICEVKGAKLRICFNGDGRRPTGFGPAALGASRFARLVVLERMRAEKEQDPRAEVRRLEGLWMVVNTSPHEVVLPESQQRGAEWIIEGESITFGSELKLPEKDRLGRYFRVGAVNGRRWIEVSLFPRRTVDGGSAICVQRGLYVLEGDQLRLYLAGAGEKQPMAFPAERGLAEKVLLLKRAKR
jgi:uncharacterized protein (TIGR03067 family)